MNASTAVVLADAPRRAARRLSSFPVVPVAIIAVMVLIALGADALARRGIEEAASVATQGR